MYACNFIYLWDFRAVSFPLSSEVLVELADDEQVTVIRTRESVSTVVE